MEELLDSYGARRNMKWRRLRGAVAGIKLFSEVAYTLLHIRLFMPRYQLLPVEPDFAAATDAEMEFTCRTLQGFAARLLECAQELALPIDENFRTAADYVEGLPIGGLRQDCGTEGLQSVEETVVYLSTAFLNLAEEGRILQIRPGKQRGASDLIPDPFNEENLRTLEDAFHGLQARYDTYVADTNLESIDPDLRVLRGHISVIYHLLQTATSYCHYYERHVRVRTPAGPGAWVSVVDSDRLLSALIDYSVQFADNFIQQTRELCHRMLRRYSVAGSLEVAVPRYRGFHVRPTTLIARIVRHYGAEVQMRLEDEEYDAAVPFDLFRANEKLNAQKRRSIAIDVVEVLKEGNLHEERSREELIRAVARRLFEKRRLILYDRALSLDNVNIAPETTIEQCVVEALNKLLTIGKIDVELVANATFLGDQRVLSDIGILAGQNYGEDDFGNNLALPPELSYLRR
jgi:phosphotransferase system HPr-like phosphotransfer protein